MLPVANPGIHPPAHAVPGKKGLWVMNESGKVYGGKE